MNTSPAATHLAAIIVRWVARLLSVAAVGVLLTFLIGEGFNPLHLKLRDLALCVFFPFGLMIGLVLAWRWELLGGLIAAGSILGFYAIHLALAGSLPRGWAFPAFAVPGFLFLIARLLADSPPAAGSPPNP